jgi:predicted Zn finger-like uncharacterized protein
MTLIICPACDTRYEIAAVLPAEGRKVRCSKCGHVWQAVAATTQPEPVQVARPVPAPPSPPPQAPRPQMPQATQAEARPQTGAVNPALRGFAGIARVPQEPAPKAPPPFPEPRAAYEPPAPQPEPAMTYPPPASFAGDVAAAMGESGMKDAEFEGGEELDADFAAFGETPAHRTNGPEPGLPSVQPGRQVAAFEDFALSAMDNAVPAAVEPGAVPSGEKKRMRLSGVALGWVLLALLVLLVGGLFMFAPRMVVAMLPGAQRLYAMAGIPVNARGLTFDGVRYGWSTDTGEAVLTVQGEVVNVTAGSVDVPTVVVALRDEGGQELSQWTTKVQGEQLAAGEHAPFSIEIPSPPDTVRSVKVRFAAAE